MLFFLSFGYTNAQNFKFGKVSEQELAEKLNPLDSTANATVLYKSEKINFDYRRGEGFVQIREIHERIKIYNKEGFDWATKKVRLYNKSSSNSESLQFIKGYTYNLVNGKVEEDKLKNDGIFEEELNKYWKYKSFTMPNIKEGCVIEYKYEISSPYLAIDDIELQYTIPINRLEVSVKTPEYYIYNKLLNPKAAINPKIVESRNNRSETIISRNGSIVNISIQTSSKITQSKLEFIENVITCEESNIPALKDEPFVDNLKNYQAKLILELSATKFPNEPYNSLASTWESVTKTIYNDSDFGNQLDRSGYYDDDINALISGETDDLKKIELIYNYVKSKVKWNGFYGFTSEIGARKAYIDGVGNSADINLMLISMLRYAGINADPVLVSTKNNGIPLFPTRQGFNYVICFVANENFNVLLDATDKYGYFNTLPIRAINWQGRLIRENQSSDWISLSPNMLSNEITSLNVKMNSDLTIDGKVRLKKTHYVAKRFRDNFAGINSDEYIKYLEKDKGNLTVSDLEIENAKTVSEPINISYNYVLNDGVEEIGNNLYFSPLLFLTLKENPFKQDKRNYPIDFIYPTSYKYIVNIMLPDGYEVESLPESSKFQFKGDQGEFMYLIKPNGKYLQLSMTFDLKTPFIMVEDYEYFKDFYTLLVEKQAEKVVLKKI